MYRVSSNLPPFLHQVVGNPERRPVWQLKRNKYLKTENSLLYLIQILRLYMYFSMKSGTKSSSKFRKAIFFPSEKNIISRKGTISRSNFIFRPNFLVTRGIKIAPRQSIKAPGVIESTEWHSFPAHRVSGINFSSGILVPRIVHHFHY